MADPAEPPGNFGPKDASSRVAAPAPDFALAHQLWQQAVYTAAYQQVLLQQSAALSAAAYGSGYGWPLPPGPAASAAAPPPMPPGLVTPPGLDLPGATVPPVGWSPTPLPQPVHPKQASTGLPIQAWVLESKLKAEQAQVSQREWAEQMARQYVQGQEVLSALQDGTKAGDQEGGERQQQPKEAGSAFEHFVSLVLGESAAPLPPSPQAYGLPKHRGEVPQLPQPQLPATAASLSSASAAAAAAAAAAVAAAELSETPWKRALLSEPRNNKENRPTTTPSAATAARARPSRPSGSSVEALNARRGRQKPQGRRVEQATK